MESSPLIKAHDHARVASTATHTADTTVAINEHTRAAGEFANAARNTNSVEALRTLKLLEQHHQRLSELLQLPFKRPAQNTNNTDESGTQEKDDTAAATTTGGTSSAQSAHSSNAVNVEKGGQPLPTLARQPKYPSRDLGASIASNLASARGIRSKYRGQPLSPSVSNTEAPGNVNVEAGSRKNGSRVKMQDMLEHSEKSSPVGSPEKMATRQHNSSTASQQDRETPLASPTTATPSSGDEGFSKFYSAFGTIINRISAPLAFAGLPLISEEQSSSEQPAPIPVPEPTTHNKRLRLKPSPSVAAEPDISKIYSKATLRAISRDGQSGTDSFYVVPTSGHTASYASILSYADKEKRRRSNRNNEPGGDGRGGKGLMMAEDADEDDFVDARESQQMPHSRSPPRLRKRGAGGKGGGGSGGYGHGPELAHVVEELYLENKSLKDALDKLSKRLHAFESMSQNSGMRLAESMRLMRPGSPPPSSAAAATSPSPAAAARTVRGAGDATGAGAGAGASDDLVKRNRELEEQLMQASRQMTEMERDYTKARANLARYRERWEQLKAGAKARRTGTQGGTSETADEAMAGASSSAAAAAGTRSPSLA
ncbi:hypothetical protein SLS62_007717 [Diatrype stigma]|uniref:Uncharacterized protein n=1 Tax=Diatrype stigma TaxID=117547 RepID=A0AAN9UQA1_9PEZI